MSDELREEPWSLEAEQSVIGACLQDRDVIISVAPALTPHDFYQRTHQIIWQAMRRLYDRRIPADMTTITAEIERERSGQVDASYLTELMTSAPTAVHAPYYAEIVREHAVRRRLINAAREIVTLAYDQHATTDAVVSGASDAISAVMSEGRQGDVITAADAIRIMMDELDVEQRHARIVRSGYPDLDRAVGGFQPGQLITIGARPGVGKSAFGIQLAYQQSVREKRSCGFVSLEMTVGEVMQRMVALAGNVNMHAYRNLEQPDFETHGRVTNAAGIVSNGALHIVRRSDRSLAQITTQAKQMHARHGIECLIVDYLQLMTARTKENRAQQVGEVSRGLKSLAMELEIPVIALAQLNRQVEQRGEDAVPKLSDLRDSGEIEQDSDIVIFIHRQPVSLIEERRIKTDFIIAKHRQGPTDVIPMAWVPHTARFVGVAGNRDDYRERAAD